MFTFALLISKGMGTGIHDNLSNLVLSNDFQC